MWRNWLGSSLYNEQYCAVHKQRFCSMCFRGQLSATHFIIVLNKKYCWRSSFSQPKSKSNAMFFGGKNVSSADWRRFGLKCTKKKKERKENLACVIKLKEKLLFSTCHEDKTESELRPNRNILILYYQFRRDCCFVLNELNICKAITIIIINNVWTLLDRQGLTPCMYKMRENHSPINLENMLSNLSSYI